MMRQDPSHTWSRLARSASVVSAPFKPYAALSPATIFFRSRITSSFAYIRYPFIGCRRAGNFPELSHRRSVGKLTASSRAASAMVMRSAGSGCFLRGTSPSLTNVDRGGNEGLLSCPTL